MVLSASITITSGARACSNPVLRAAASPSLASLAIRVHRHHRMVVDELPYDSAAVVGCMVFDDDELELHVLARHDALEGLGHDIGVVVQRHDHAHLWGRRLRTTVFR